MLPFQRLADCPEYRPTLPTHPLSTHPSSACRMPVGLNRRFGHPGQGFGAVPLQGTSAGDCGPIGSACPGGLWSGDGCASSDHLGQMGL